MADQQGGAVANPMGQRDAVRQLIFRAGIFYALYHFYIKPKQEAQQNVQNSVHEVTPIDVTPGANQQPNMMNQFAEMLGVQTGPVPSYYNKKLSEAWPANIHVEARVFVSESPHLLFVDAAMAGPDAPNWIVSNVDYSTKAENYVSKNVSLYVPGEVRLANASWYAHIFVATDRFWNAKPSQLIDKNVKQRVLYYKHEIITWKKIDMKKKGKNLLGGQENQDEQEKESEDKENADEDEDTDVKYEQVYKPKLDVTLVTGGGQIMLSQLPPRVADFFRVDTEENIYYPPMHVNEFWQMEDSLLSMNISVTEVVIEMSFTPMSLYKWSLYQQFESMWEKQIKLGTMAPKEKDDMKRIFIETNPVLLGTTMLVSVAHTILETLAFKNEISHWNNIKSMEGVSVRSMIWGIIMEAIIFLYLWDNETSWMITIGNGVGIIIGLWKLGKAVKFEKFGEKKLLGFIPWFQMTDRESYSKKTKEYDDQAMKYLAYALYPLVICYAIYTLLYEEHKSWYSWVIGSLVGAVYAFGFIMMFPQIFINYKLKSVAHMPMKAMMYKTLNTIIDDLFSFIIKMPWLHRLACFRDDIVFLIILYQRWIYPVDKTRVNEFGESFEKDKQAKKESSKKKEEKSSTTEITESETTTTPKSQEAKKKD